ESSRCLLAAGNSATYWRTSACAWHESIWESVELSLCERRARFSYGQLSRSEWIALGFVSRTDRGRCAISSHIPPIQLAGMAELWRRRARRHGRALDRSAVLGSRTHVSD